VDSDRVGPRDGLPRDERRRAGSCPQFQERNALTAAAAVTVTAVIVDNEPNGSTLFSFYGFDDQKLSLPASTKLLLVSRAAPSRQSMIARMKYRGSKRATGSGELHKAIYVGRE